MLTMTLYTKELNFSNLIMIGMIKLLNLTYIPVKSYLNYIIYNLVYS